MRLKIEAKGRTVEVETADANLNWRDLMSEALAAWQATGTGSDSGSGDPPGAAFGVSLERKARVDEPTAHGGYGSGYLSEVKA